MCLIQDRRTSREHGISSQITTRGRLMDESGDSSGYESGVSIRRLPLKKQETVDEH